ncbi:unnamed protein product [Prorocentrum cordatum]|uniref:Uncharacterized protein n=1 Tax=Prorocentrum cordatum TaxID=2364126 RepID=A0ABN9PNM8_9DINO|nr:unnamed protein product [Polarella glacialis]
MSKRSPYMFVRWGSPTPETPCDATPKTPCGTGLGAGVCVGAGVAEGVNEVVDAGVVEGVAEGVSEVIGAGVAEGVNEVVDTGVVEGVAEGVSEVVGAGVAEGVNEVVDAGVVDGVNEVVDAGVGEAVGEGASGGASATKLTLAGLWGISVTQPVRLVAVRRSHLCEAVMDPADGYASYIMAASPETCEQAMEVPELVPSEVSLRWDVERMLEPGAQTSTQLP